MTDIGTEGKGGNFYILYSGARTNGQAVLAPDTDLLDNIAYLRTKRKVAVRTMNIRYSQNGPFSPTQNMGSYCVNLIKMMFGSFIKAQAFI